MVSLRAIITDIIYWDRVRQRQTGRVSPVDALAGAITDAVYEALTAPDPDEPPPDLPPTSEVQDEEDDGDDRQQDQEVDGGHGEISEEDHTGNDNRGYL